MSKDVDRIDRVVKFVGQFILEFSALMPVITVLYREHSGLDDTETEDGFLKLRDDAARLEKFRDLAHACPDDMERKRAIVVVAEKAIELCRFRAVLAHGVLGGDRLHDDPELIPNFFLSGAKFRKVVLSEDNMRRHFRQLIDVSDVAKGLLPRGVKIDLGGHSVVIEEIGGKTGEDIFEELGIPLNERDKGNKNVAIKFVYSVSRTVSGGAILQFHEQKRVQKVSGKPDEYGMPTIRQLHIAERDFLEQWQHFEPNGYLISYKTVPADGARALFSEYNARLGA